METKEIVEQINREFNELKSVLARGTEEQKTFGARLGETSAKLEAINARIDAIEVKAQRAFVPGTKAEREAVNPARTKAFGTFLRKGMGALAPDEVKLLSIADDTSGGFGATEEFDSEVLKGITQISPVRELVKVRTTGARSFKQMKRTATFAAVRAGERSTRTETTGYALGLEEVPVHELYAMVDVSRADLEDTHFDLEAELMMEFAEQFAKKEGTEFITGTGNGMFEGLEANSAISEDVSGDANNLTYTGLVNVSHNGKEGYDWKFIFNRKTLGKMRLLTDGNDNPLWVPMAAGAPATVLGLPYVIVPDCDDVAANAHPVFCGDFKRGYVMGDRTSLTIVRDDVTQMGSGAVRFWAYRRNGGQVILAEAIRKLKIAAS